MSCTIEVKVNQSEPAILIANGWKVSLSAEVEVAKHGVAPSILPKLCVEKFVRRV